MADRKTDGASGAFADAIAGNAALTRTPKPSGFGDPSLFVFRSPAARSFPPAPEAARAQFPAHQGNDFGWRKSELRPNGFEGRAVFPGHFNEAVQVVGLEGG